jgi:amino acid transporter
MSLYSKLKLRLIGASLPNGARTTERLSNAVALAVLSSDALSSVAYATEEILNVLVLSGSEALSLSLPIAITIVLLLAIVTLSYRQTLRAYPTGGGAYTVAGENLGLYPGLIAAAALMIDYVLTVTVSIAAGTAALTSAIPSLQTWNVELCLLFTLLLMLANLRGVKESGNLFVIPTYAFVVSIFGLIAIGLFHQLTGQITQIIPVLPVREPLSLFILMRAFAAGCTAMTGVEAISNGVLVFKSPEWKNAQITMLTMSVMLGMMFIGITHLAQGAQIVPTANQTVLSSLARQAFGDSPVYYFIQVVTLLILILAANTSYADYPRLSSLLAKDSFLPRQLMLLGDRLVFSNGIVLLSLLAAFLLIIFQANVNAIVPLYAVGVFTSFTLSQAGMVRHWFESRADGWQTSAFINGIGSIVTAIVALVIVITKFQFGAWIIVVAIPLLVSLFLAIRHHYREFARRLSLKGLEPRINAPRIHQETGTHPAVVLVGQLHQGTVEALDYARTVADEIVAVHVDIGFTDRARLERQWQQLESDISLVILDSPYRSVTSPVLDFIHDFEARHQGIFLTVIIPNFVIRYWWENILHNQSAYFLKSALRKHKNRIVTTVDYYL